MSLPLDWRFNPDHTGLDEGGAMASGELTLVDWAATVALSPVGSIPDAPTLGAGLPSVVFDPDGTSDTRSLGESLRGLLLQDDRVEDVDTQSTTLAGRLRLPVRLAAAQAPSYRLSGPLTEALIADIVRDVETSEEGED